MAYTLCIIKTLQSILALLMVNAQYNGLNILNILKKIAYRYIFSIKTETKKKIILKQLREINRIYVLWTFKFIFLHIHCIIKYQYKQMVIEYRNVMKHIQLIHFIVSPTIKIVIIIKFCFIKATTCHKKCIFRIYDLNCGDKYSLRGIFLTIGDWEKSILECSRSHSWKYMYLYINCSSWSAGKSCIQIYIMNNQAWKRIKLVLVVMSLLKIIFKKQ